MKRILAFDPGLTTGYVDVVWENTQTTDFRVLEARDIEWAITPLIVHRCITTLLPDIVLYERFTLFPHLAQQQIGSDFPSSQVIGMIILSCQLCALTPIGYKPILISQPASIQARASIRGSHQKALTGLHHAKSAYLHVLYYITTEYTKKRRPKG